jgi:hypothetical protein
MKKADLDILLKKLEEGEIEHIEEKNQYLKELEMAYMNTKKSDSRKFKIRPTLFTEEEIEKGYHKMARKRNGAIE